MNVLFALLVASTEALTTVRHTPPPRAPHSPTHLNTHHPQGTSARSLLPSEPEERAPLRASMLSQVGIVGRVFSIASAAGEA